MKRFILSFGLLFFLKVAFSIETPSLVSPENGATDQPTELTLDWEAVSGASYYEYQYSTSNSFTTYWNDYLEETEATITALNNDYTYYWRVRASDGSLFSEWSEVWSFTTIEAGTGLATPTLVAPANGEANVIETPQLLWNIVPGANEYEYQYSMDDTFATFEGSTTQSTAISIGPLEFASQYFWRVKATDGTQFSDWSAVWNFYTEDELGVELSSAFNVSCSPNPVHDQMLIQSQNVIQSIEVVNTLGQIVVEKEVEARTYMLNTSDLKQGLYFLKISISDRTTVKKIIIRH